MLLFLGGFVHGDEIPDSTLKRIQSLSNSAKISYLNEICWSNRDNDPKYVINIGKYALALSDSLELDEQKSVTLSYIGVAYRNIGLLTTAENYFTQAYNLAAEQKNFIQIGFAYNNICRVNILKGEYPKAVQNAFQAMNAFETASDLRGQGYASLNLGRIYREQKNYSKALEYIRESVRIREQLNDEELITSAKVILAQVYVLLEDYNTALEMYKTILKSYIDLNNKRGLASVYSGIANVYFRLNNYRRSLENIRKSLFYTEEINDQFSSLHNYLVLGRIYTAEKQYKKAEEIFISIIKQSKEFGFTQPELTSYNELSNLFKKIGRYDQSVLYLEKFNNLNEEIYGQKISNTIADLQTSYELTKKEYENTALKERLEEENKRIILLQIIVILVVILGILSFGKYRANVKANKLLKELNFTKDKYFRILAHELRTPISSILGYSDMIIYEYKNLTDSDKYNIFSDMNKLLHNMYFLLDNLLNWAATQVKEVKIYPEEFRIYEIWEEVRLIFDQAAAGKKIEIINNLDPGLKCYSDKVMTKAVLRNLLSNSIKFTDDGGKVFVNAQLKNGFVQISVRDTGVGLTEAEMEKLFKLDTHFSKKGTRNEQGSGLGLLLAKEFVEINGGQLVVNNKLEQGLELSFTLRAGDNT